MNTRDKGIVMTASLVRLSGRILSERTRAPSRIIAVAIKELAKTIVNEALNDLRILAVSLLVSDSATVLESAMGNPRDTKAELNLSNGEVI